MPLSEAMKQQRLPSSLKRLHWGTVGTTEALQTVWEKCTYNEWYGLHLSKQSINNDDYFSDSL